MTKPLLEQKSTVLSAQSCLVNISLLKKHVPLRAVNSILKKASKESIRQRSLPAQVMVYYVIAMTMFMEVSLREVVRLLLPPTRSTKRRRPPVSSAITQARQRLGSEPLELLYQEIAKPIATEKTRGAWFRGLRLIAIDGSTLSVADTVKNDEAFGRPKVRLGIMAFPRIFMVSLVEVGTRVLFAAKMGPSSTSSEMSLAKEIMSSLCSGMLCLADRYYCSYPFWKLATQTGADLLFRAKVNLVLPITKILPDGSYLSYLYPSTKDREMKTNGIEVRVIEYRMPVVQNNEPFYRLITTILDHKTGAAAELAALYAERWQIETAYDELKTHLRGGADVILRSKTPDLVKQEFYGLLLAYFSVRAIIHEAAASTDDDPDRLSFIHAVRVIKRHLPQMAACSPRRRLELHNSIIAEILQERVVTRTTRTNHRGIKRKSPHAVADRSQDRKLIMPVCNFIKIRSPEKQKNRAQIVN